MKNLKTVIFGIFTILMLCGCGANENYENTTSTHTPEATHDTKKDDNSVRDDVGNVIDDAGDAVDNSGKAIGDAVKDVGDTVKE